jgi:hypothetical protein
MARPKGTPNKSTAAAREAIAAFVDLNAGRLQGWLDKVAEGVVDDSGKVIVKADPQKAFELFQSVVEYHVPKLARTELTGKDEGPVQLVVTWQDPK